MKRDQACVPNHLSLCIYTQLGIRISDVRLHISPSFSFRQGSLMDYWWETWPTVSSLFWDESQLKPPVKRLSVAVKRFRARKEVSDELK